MDNAGALGAFNVSFYLPTSKTGESLEQGNVVPVTRCPIDDRNYSTRPDDREQPRKRSAEDVPDLSRGYYQTGRHVLQLNGYFRIVKISDGEPISAWPDADLVEGRIPAQSPKAIAESGHVIQINDSHRLYVSRAP